ncbi:MAG: helix-turn-helix domain-containing protein [Blastocatellia bacterium]
MVTQQTIALTEQEFCNTVRISRVTAWRLRRAGKLPHARVGRRILFTPDHIERFLRSMEVNTNANTINR